MVMKVKDSPILPEDRDVYVPAALYSGKGQERIWSAFVPLEQTDPSKWRVIIDIWGGWWFLGVML